jgi:ABC-type multidrug transport system fused ATPase/permease subunit
MLGVAAERVPRGGALALGLLGGWGMAVVGLVTVPLMGFITDTYGHEKLPAVETKACIVQGAEELKDARKASIEAADEDMAAKIDEALELARTVIAETNASGDLPARDTAKALRGIAKFGAESEAGKQADALIKPADEYGGPFSFRWVSALAVVLVVIFGLLYVGDRARGGYKAEKL